MGRDGWGTPNVPPNTSAAGVSVVGLSVVGLSITGVTVSDLFFRLTFLFEGRRDGVGLFIGDR